MREMAAGEHKDAEVEEAASLYREGWSLVELGKIIS